MSATDTNDRTETATAEVVQLPATPRHFVVAADVFSDPASFEHAQRVARVFASSNLVPAHLKGQVADCLIAYQIARRLNEEPLTVFQNIYIVSGRPGWKTEYMISRANKAGVFKDRITWDTSGEGETLAVTAHATLADSGKKIKATCDMKMARAENWTKNPKYTSMPEHMLRWRSAAMLIRLYAPEVMLGMPVIEELETLPPTPMRDISPAMRRSLDDFAQGHVEQVDPATGEVTQTNSDAARSTPSAAAEAAAPASPGPAADTASSQSAPPPAATAPGQAVASDPPKDQAAAAGPKKESAFTSLPKNEQEYTAYARAWFAEMDDVESGDKRWASEKGLRNKAQVSGDVREALKGELEQKQNEIRDADRD